MQSKQEKHDRFFSIFLTLQIVGKTFYEVQYLATRCKNLIFKLKKDPKFDLVFIEQSYFSVIYFFLFNKSNLKNFDFKNDGQIFGQKYHTVNK